MAKKEADKRVPPSDEIDDSVEGHVNLRPQNAAGGAEQAGRPQSSTLTPGDRRDAATPRSAEGAAGALRAIAASTVRACHGVIPGWAPTMRARCPVTTAAAKLFPLATTLPPPFQATSRSMPAAPHSAGPRGLHQMASRSSPGPQATENTPASSLGIVALAFVVHRRDERHAAERRPVDEFPERLR